MRLLSRRVGPSLWLCDRCGGVWIPDGKASGAEPPEELETALSPVGGVDAKAGLCPAGHGILSRARTPFEDGFYLDRCSVCSGVWFDQGEWQKVAAEGLVVGLFEMWTEPWQRKERAAAAAEAYRRQLEAALGPELSATLMHVAESLRAHPARSLALGFIHSRSRR